MKYTEDEILQLEIQVMNGKEPTKEPLDISDLSYGKGIRICTIHYKNCQECSKLYIARRASQKFCSSQCREHNSRIRNREKSNERRRKVGYDKECTECGTLFYTKYPNVKQCSDKCKSLSRIKIKTCVECNTQFKKGYTLKFCRKECFDENTEKNTKKCKTCGKSLKTNRYTYCSDKCKSKKDPLDKRKCEQCKLKYYPKRCDQKYCSKKCRRIKYRKSDSAKIYANSKKNKDLRKEYKRLRKRKTRKAKLNVESWNDIKLYIESRPSDNHDLDHIIPLNHPDVCGLHNTWNFQWLLKEDNVKKSNNFDGTVENKSWKS